MVRKNSYITLVRQEAALRHLFPNAKITRNADSSLTWEQTIKPTSVSEEYSVRLVYHRKTGIEVYILTPNLKLADGKVALPHVYSTKKQMLCLYYPNGLEWNRGKLFTQTIIPWISEWLYFYEVWVGSGNWYGGGITHEKTAETKQLQKQ